MRSAATKIRGAVQRARGAVITTGYAVWKRMPVRTRIGAKKILGRLPQKLQSKLQRNTGLEVPVNAAPAPQVSEVELTHALNRPGFAESSGSRVYIAPSGHRGQTVLLANALEAAGVGAHTVQHGGRQTAHLRVDRLLPRTVVNGSEQWRRTELEWVANNFTHVLSVGGRAVFGPLFDRSSALVEAELLRGTGIVTGFLFSDGIRIAEIDRANNPDSAYFDPDCRRSNRSEKLIVKFVEQLRELDLPVFVDVPDLIDSIPDGYWLPPITIAPEHLSPATGEEMPNVFHLWSDDPRRGQVSITEVLEGYATGGKITHHRIRATDLAAISKRVAPGDIVIDDLQITSYSTGAAQALRNGAVVVGNVSSRNVDRIAAVTGLEPPVHQATPGTFTESFEQLLADPERQAELSSAALNYAQKVHDGALSVKVVRQYLLSE